MSMAIELHSYRSHRQHAERRSGLMQAGSESPAALVASWVRGAEVQLLAAREELKAARRRVVQLEDAVTAWRGFASDLARDRPRVGTSRP